MSQSRTPAASARRPALGRGLSALIPGAASPAQSPRGLMTVPIGEVSGEPSQPRRYWDAKALAELAESIRAKGMLQPILVRRLDEGGYRVVAGERRLRAAREAGLVEVPVIVREVDEASVFELALIENIQRQDLNPVEEAEAYHRLLTDHGLTQEGLAQRVGKERSTIANALRLLKLPSTVREQVASGVLSTGHAKALLGVGDADELLRLAHRATEKGLSVRELERAVQRTREPEVREEPPQPPVRLQAQVRKLARLLPAVPELRVRASGGGELVFRFDSEVEGVRLLELLVASIKG